MAGKAREPAGDGQGRLLAGTSDIAGRAAALVATAAAAVAREVEPERVTAAIVEQTLALGATASHLFFVRPGSRELLLARSYNVPVDLERRIGRVTFDAPLLAARAARLRELQWAAATDHGVSDLAREFLVRTGSRMLVSVPLVAHGELVGVLSWTLSQVHEPAEDELSATYALADVFALGLEAAFGRERERRLRRQLEMLRDAALAVSAPRQLGPVLQLIVEHARTISGARWAALGIVSPRGLSAPFEPWVYSGIPEELAARVGRHPRPVGLLGYVPIEGRVLRLSDATRDPHFRGFPPGHPPMVRFLGVPITRGGSSLGNLYLANEESADEFSAEDERAVMLLAQHAAVAVEHARANERLAAEVAERHRAETRLHATLARFRRLSDNAPDPVFRYQLSPPRVEYVSPAVVRVTGFSPEEFYAKPSLVIARLHPDDRPMIEAWLAAPSDDTGPLQFRWRRRDDGWAWVECTLVPVYDESGAFVAIETIARDVTGRRQAEQERERLVEQLEAEKEWLRTVLDTSPVAVLLFEPGGAVRANARAEALFGLRVDADGGCDQFVPVLRRPDHTPLSEADRIVDAALRGEAKVGVELLVVQPGGREIPVLVSAMPIRGAYGRHAGAVAVCTDISSVKQLERLRDEWMSIVAHDLRQPATIIAAHATIVARKCDKEEIHSNIAHIQASASRLTRMISDLLDFSRLEAQRLSLERQALDPGPLVRAVVERARPQLQGRRLFVEATPDLPRVFVDAARIEQVLGNLLSNANKYGSPGTDVRVVAEARGGDLVLSVENEGEGIPPEEIPHLFQRFRRSDAGHRKGSSSVGLGLYIARGLVEAHGGRIWAESTPGGTTAFRFTIPVARRGPAT